MLSKSGIILLVLGALMVVMPPLLVYSTYPDTEGSEVGLEKVLCDLPVKPPPFLIGSMSYGLHRGRDHVAKLSVQGVDDFIYAYRPEKNERVFLVLLPYYLDKTEDKVVSGSSLKSVVMSGDATLLVEIFETHKGVVGVVLEIKLLDRTYSAMKRS